MMLEHHSRKLYFSVGPPKKCVEKSGPDFYEATNPSKLVDRQKTVAENLLFR